jgi:hypothetical protein
MQQHLGWPKCRCTEKKTVAQKGRAIKAGLFYWFMAKGNRHPLMDNCGRPSSGLDNK